MKYYRINRRETRPGIFTCIHSKEKDLTGFVGVLDGNDLPFGFIHITHRNGLWMEIKQDYLVKATKDEYDNSPHFIKREVSPHG